MRQEPRQEPDAYQARINSQDLLARARHESGQDFEARATGKSQTRIRPGLAAKSYRQEPDANQARIRRQELPARARHASGQDSRPAARSKSAAGGGGAAERNARARVA